MADLTRSARYNFGAIVATLPLVVISVALRFLIRFKRGQAALAADIMCLAATGIFVAYCVLMINFIFNTSKFHALDVDPSLGTEELINLSKMAFAAEILFGCGISAIKLSILWLYNNLFSIDQKMQRVIYVVGAIAVVWFIVATLVVVFQCKPISAVWETVASPEFCMKNHEVLLGWEMTNLFIDVAILCIPMAVLPRLHMPRAKKVSVTIVFLLGALVCVFSILRLVAIYPLPDPASNFDLMFVLFWATFQLGIAIVLSCLPVFGPMLSAIPSPVRYITWIYDSLKTRSTRTTASENARKGYASSHANSGGTQPNQYEHQWVQVDDSDIAPLQTWQASGGRAGSSEYPLQPIQPNSIHVKKNFEVV